MSDAMKKLVAAANDKLADEKSFKKKQDIIRKKTKRKLKPVWDLLTRELGHLKVKCSSRNSVTLESRADTCEEHSNYGNDYHLRFYQPCGNNRYLIRYKDTEDHFTVSESGRDRGPKPTHTFTDMDKLKDHVTGLVFAMLTEAQVKELADLGASV